MAGRNPGGGGCGGGCGGGRPPVERPEKPRGKGCGGGCGAGRPPTAPSRENLPQRPRGTGIVPPGQISAAQQAAARAQFGRQQQQATGIPRVCGAPCGTGSTASIGQPRPTSSGYGRVPPSKMRGPQLHDVTSRTSAASKSRICPGNKGAQQEVSAPIYQKKCAPAPSGYTSRPRATPAPSGIPTGRPSRLPAPGRSACPGSAKPPPPPPPKVFTRPPAPVVDFPPTIPTSLFIPHPAHTLQKTSTQTAEHTDKETVGQTTVREVVKLAPANAATAGLPPGKYVTTPPCSGPPCGPKEAESSFLETDPRLDETSPYAGGLSKGTPKSPLPPSSPLGHIGERSRLALEVEREMIVTARKRPDKAVSLSAARTTRIALPTIMTDKGPVQPVQQLITERIVEKSPGIEKVSRSMVGIEKESNTSAIRTEVILQKIDQTPPPHPSAPPREAVAIRSVVSITQEGKRESQTIVTYDSTKHSENYGLTADEVNRMVAEENQDVKKSLKWKPIELLASTHLNFSARKKEHDYTLTQDTVAELQKNVQIPDQSPDEAQQDELQPELMATIMHTEEKGMDMLAEPTTLYSYLFPDASEVEGPDVIEVSSAAPAPLHDVAVPSQNLSEAFYSASMNPELEKMILEIESEGVKPSAAAFTEYQEKMKKESTVKEKSNTMKIFTTVTISGKKKKKETKVTNIEAVPMVQDEKPPWSDDRRQTQAAAGKSILDLVGASPTSVAADLPVDSFSVGLENPDAVNYVLHVEPPVYRSKIQLRGSGYPPWFPGYYVAFPDIPEVISVVKYPTIALQAAWKNTQPKIFPDDSFVVV